MNIHTPVISGNVDGICLKEHMKQRKEKNSKCLSTHCCVCQAIQSLIMEYQHGKRSTMSSHQDQFTFDKIVEKFTDKDRNVKPSSYASTTLNV
ncbi:CLUMA_CG016062, isoform A [Clunio marinus]|uniref:CLUMA_CG016062, isoform A n=1 Tax=Clunio marinus TaxID=568069 RepID=A0A1J1IR92_9DIPT|nr:CLUMA_CG016062, isoform A [Clunio marinus]